ncbi:unnamed protein product [Vitrella brassicaformis CCMP3155]|uniref:Uncharacterized protein n=1 Tax=Vitrella brassicaformis (strain CCMP3155) TaxID=1169540 RepID=A0A0G4EG59_VITBC|nr:unnamed protein product [Vitrella brassicaformis CCMP3155]|eukprot:CEL94431.1 unnamed protein product [Vitrella brassicaformis CCMP3155]
MGGSTMAAGSFMSPSWPSLEEEDEPRRGEREMGVPSPFELPAAFETMASVVPALLLKALVLASCVGLATCKSLRTGQPEPCEVDMIAYHTQHCTNGKETTDMASVYGDQMSKRCTYYRQTCVVKEIRMANFLMALHQNDQGVGTCEETEDVAKHCNSSDVCRLARSGDLVHGRQGRGEKEQKFVERTSGEDPLEGRVFKAGHLMSIETWGIATTAKFFPGNPSWISNREAAREADMRLQNGET